MSPGEFSHFDELVSRYLDDELAPADATDLVALLAEPRLATRFLEMTRLNSEIAGLLAAPVPDAAMVELVRADIEQSLARESATRVVPPTQWSTFEVGTARPKKAGWRKLAWAAAFVLLAGLAAVLVVKRTHFREPPLLVSAQGDVRLIGPAGERGLTLAEPWRRGEKLKTLGPNSSARVTFRDGSQLGFGPDTVVVNESSHQGRRVALERGVLEAELKPQPAGRPFVFVTAQAEAVVVGTLLRLVAEGHSTRLEVREGEVRLRRRHDGGEVAVRAGHYAVAAPNVPFVATPFHPNAVR